MANEDYELLPENLIADLKTEVEALKKKLMQPDSKMNELLLEMESLKDSIHELNLVFGKALEEMKSEDLGQIFSQVSEKMETVVSQNETIARGMIAISDKLENFMSKQGSFEIKNPGPSINSFPQPIAPISHNLGQPFPTNSPTRMAPPPNFSDFGPENDFNLPPPPPVKGAMKKNKLGGLFN